MSWFQALLVVEDALSRGAGGERGRHGCGAVAQGSDHLPAAPARARQRPRGPRGAVETLVERFGRRGTEPNELFRSELLLLRCFRSEFGQNSCKIQEFSLEKFLRKFKIRKCRKKINTQ